MPLAECMQACLKDVHTIKEALSSALDCHCSTQDLHRLGSMEVADSYLALGASRYGSNLRGKRSSCPMSCIVGSLANKSLPAKTHEDKV